MGQSFLSRSAVICVFVAITFVSYCFGKYVIGGKFMQRDESVVSHIPRGYRASTDSPQPDEASPTGKSESLEHGATDGGSPHAIPDTPRISIELAKPADTGEPAPEASPDEPVQQPSAAALPKPESERASSTSDSRKSDRAVPAADKSTKMQKAKETKPTVKTAAPPVLAPKTKVKQTSSPPQPVPTPKASSPAKAPRVDSVTTNADTTYRVIVGSFESQDNSRTMATQLNKKGYYTWTTKKEVGGKTLYRVQVGAFQERDKAEQVRRDLETQGYRASVSGG